VRHGGQGPIEVNYNSWSDSLERRGGTMMTVCDVGKETEGAEVMQ
jgi:hypothetical protein